MTTKRSDYSKRDGRGMSKKEMILFDRFKAFLDMQGIAYPESIPFNLAVYKLQDYDPK